MGYVSPSYRCRACRECWFIRQGANQVPCLGILRWDYTPRDRIVCVMDRRVLPSITVPDSPINNSKEVEGESCQLPRSKRPIIGHSEDQLPILGIQSPDLLLMSTRSSGGRLVICAPRKVASRVPFYPQLHSLATISTHNQITQCNHRRWTRKRRQCMTPPDL